MNNAVNDPIVVKVIQILIERDHKGFIKYGMTTMGNPLVLRQWLQHALEESLDNAVYLRRAIEQIDRDNPVGEDDHPHASE